MAKKVIKKPRKTSATRAKVKSAIKKAGSTKRHVGGRPNDRKK